VDPIDDRSTEVGSSLGQQPNAVSDSFALRVRQGLPPLGELVGELDLPHPPSMSFYS